MKKLLLSSLLILSYNIPIKPMNPEYSEATMQQFREKWLNLSQLNIRVKDTVSNLISSMQNALNGRKGRAAQMATQIALQKIEDAKYTTLFAAGPSNIDYVINAIDQALQVAIEATDDVHVIAQQFDAGHEQDPAIPTRSQAREHRNMVEEVTRKANTIIQEAQGYLERDEFSEDPATREREIEAAHNAIRTAHEVLEMTHMPITMQNAKERISSLSLTIYNAKKYRDEIDLKSRLSHIPIPLVWEMPKDTVQQ